MVDGGDSPSRCTQGTIKCPRGPGSLSQEVVCFAFCEFVAGEQELMQQLQEFSELSPPTLVWKQGGRFSKLFVFLAVRFLSNPSHVLECEGIHARWQWLEQGQRSVKMKTMNSVLKLSAYMLYQGDLPPADVLLPHIQLTRLHMREMYQLACQGHVAPGARAEWVYRDRFNLSLADANLLRAPQAQRQQGGNSSPQVRRRKKQTDTDRPNHTNTDSC